MEFWLCPLIAFFLGSIPFGLLIAKIKGIDIRQHGSGNIGATNVLRVLGKKHGIACLVLDVLKGFIPVLLAKNLLRVTTHHGGMYIDGLDAFAWHLPESALSAVQSTQVITGLCAILGHNFSPWVSFKGGKGIATSAGVLLALMPAGVGILVIVWVLTAVTSRYVSLASIVAALALPLVTIWGSWFHGKIQNGTWNKPLFAFSLVIAILAVWKHLSNIRRLLNGTEHRFSRKS